MIPSRSEWVSKFFPSKARRSWQKKATFSFLSLFAPCRWTGLIQTKNSSAQHSTLLSLHPLRKNCNRQQCFPSCLLSKQPCKNACLLPSGPVFSIKFGKPDTRKFVDLYEGNIPNIPVEVHKFRPTLCPCAEISIGVFCTPYPNARVCVRNTSAYLTATRPLRA